VRTFEQETTEEKAARIAAVNAENRREYMAIVAAVASREAASDADIANEAAGIWCLAEHVFNAVLKETR
jgi:hypothetical protein